MRSTTSVRVLRTPEEIAAASVEARDEYVALFRARFGLSPATEWLARWWPRSGLIALPAFRDTALLRVEVRTMLDELARSASKPTGEGYDEREVDGYAEAVLRLFGR